MLVVTLFGGVFAVSAAVGIVAAWRLSEGPVALGFLTPWLQERIGSLPNDKTLGFTDVQVVWDGESGALDLQVLNASLTDAEGHEVASVPEAALSFDGPSLTKGRIRLRTVKLTGLSLDVRRQADGSLELGLAETGDDSTQVATPMRPLDELLDELFASGDGADGPLSRLRRIILRDSQVVLNDVARGQFFLLRVDDVSVSAANRSVIVEGAVELDAATLRIPLDVGLILNRETGFTLVNLDIDPFEVSELVQVLDGPSILLGFQFPIGGRASLQVKKDGQLGPVRMALKAGRGQLAMPGILVAPVPVLTAEIQATFDPGTAVLAIDRMSYESGLAGARASGTVRITDEGPDMNIVIEGEDLANVLIPTYWPVDRAAGARNWLEEHLVGGSVEYARARLDMRPADWALDVPPAAALDVRLRFRDTRVKLYEPYDDIVGGSGEVVVTGRTLDVTLEEAESAGLKVSDGVLNIDDFAKRRPILTTEFVGEGSIIDSVGASVRGALARSLGGAPDVSGMLGQAATRVRLSLPVASDTTLSEIQIGASSHVANVRAENLYGGMTFTADALALRVDAERLEVQGAGALNNVPMALRWIEEFNPKDGFGQHFSIGGRIDRSSIDRLGIGIELPAWIDGAVGLQTDLHLNSAGVIAATVALDLTSTVLMPPGGLWQKQAGDVAKARFNLFRTPGNVIRLDDLIVSAPDLEVQGAISGTLAGGLDSLELDLLHLGADRLSGRLARGDNGVWELDVAGETLNAVPLLELARQPSEGAGPDFSVNGAFTFGSLRLHTDIALRQARGQFSLIGGELASLTMAGSAGESQSLNLSVTPAANTLPGTVGNRSLLLESGDAGGLLTALDLTNALQGGVLKLTANITADGQATGLLGIDNFRLTETPTAARLLSLASLTGIGQAMSGEGLGFVRADVPFRYDGTRLHFRSARAAGPALGFTADGYLDRETEELRLVGNVIPAYSLSSVLGAIPLIGTILGGDDGVFGVTYAIEGPAIKPTITVNPLSALAPGILRRMFLEPVNPLEQAEVPLEPTDDR